MDKKVVALPANPLLQPGVELVPITLDRALLRWFSGTVMISGNFVRDVLPGLLLRLDGSRTLDELASEIGADYRTELEDFLHLMNRKGLLKSGEPNRKGHAEDGAWAYWTLYGSGADAVAERLAAATLVLVGLGKIGAVIAREVAEAGIGRLVLVDSDQDIELRSAENAGCKVSRIGNSVDNIKDWESVVSEASLVVICSDAMALAGYARTNEACIRSRTPWVSARIDRNRAILGPFVIPGQTPCFTCFELRSRANANHPDDHEALYLHWKQVRDVPLNWPSLPPIGNIVGGMLALDILRVLGGGHLSVMAGRVLHLDLQDFSTSSHEILKLPRCPACSRLRSLPLTRIWDIGPKPPAAKVTK